MWWLGCDDSVEVQSVLLVPRQTGPPARRVEVELRLNIRKQFIAITRFHINTKTETFVKIEKK